MVTLDSLEKINLTELGDLITESQFRSYFLDQPGKEHYRLLAYLSTQYNNATLLDVGTYKGCSAVALSFNPTNRIVSFDIEQGTISINSKPNNVDFIVDDILKKDYVKLILSSPLVLLDTAHEGPFEHQFYFHLCDIGWKGTLLLDDINLNNEMRDFWESIKKEKHDLTSIGHHSGTGLVIFK